MPHACDNKGSPFTMDSFNVQRLIYIHAVNPRIHKGTVTLNTQSYKCALGKHGLAMRKKEGDDKTPIGQWPLRAVFYRADRVKPPVTYLPVIPIQKTMGWCDDPQHNKYNQLISFPFEANAERLWRQDHLYDLMVVLGYNDRPVVRGRGSAIFMHLAKADYGPTQGCTALNQSDLRKLLRVSGPETHLKIG